MKQNRKTGFFSVQTMIFTTIIILLFIGVILVYYARLYSETRERILKISELNAESSAEQIDKYLSTGVDILRLAGYSLDNMIRDGRSQQEIRDYLVNQSFAILNITSKNCNGLYGYINGEYLDGTDWVPEEGYEATARPWYVDARASIGRVAIVDPYIDAETQTTMISLAKTLCDGKSVVAMDFSIQRLQSIAEELADQGDCKTLLLDRGYRVIAHSDKEEIGKDYFRGDACLGSAIVDQMRSTNENFFSLDYEGSEYIVYATTVANDWFCLSVTDATPAFNHLKRSLSLIIAAALLIIGVQLFILVRSERNTRITQQLAEDLTQAENDLYEREEEIGQISRVAFRDALTGVGSKAALDRFAGEFTQTLETQPSAFGIVMMDANNLKYINDAYGHEAGDKYLCGCCRLICKTFAHSPVYRIGGDEFVVVLQNADFENRADLFRQLNETFEKAYAKEDGPEWERYSISAGMADGRPEDRSIERALTEADHAMYNAKQAFRKDHGSYR
ncbi:MAG: diguanylate cyclase [Lachnospiraceae bacterium]|nr:diguanylate cyclase [Lachnospiraceae bacterium]